MKSIGFATALLRLVFLNETISGLARGWVLPSQLTLALHTADPGPKSDQGTFELRYSGYRRVSVPRTVQFWSVNGGEVALLQPVEFAECQDNSDTAKWVSVGCDGLILYRSQLERALDLKPGVVPEVRAVLVTEG